MGREEIFIDLGGRRAQKTPIFNAKNDSNSEFHCLRPLRRPCWMACGPLALKNVQGSWGNGPVREYGLQVRAGAPYSDPTLTLSKSRFVRALPKVP